MMKKILLIGILMAATRWSLCRAPSTRLPRRHRDWRIGAKREKLEGLKNFPKRSEGSTTYQLGAGAKVMVSGIADG